MPGSPPHVAAIAVWAHAQGLTRGKQQSDVSAELTLLRKYEDQLHSAGDEYWAAQVHILSKEVAAWSSQAGRNPGEAASLLRQSSAPVKSGTSSMVVEAGTILSTSILKRGRFSLALLWASHHRRLRQNRDARMFIVCDPMEAST